MVSPLQQRTKFLESPDISAIRQLPLVQHDLERYAVMYHCYEAELGAVPTGVQNTAMYTIAQRRAEHLGGGLVLIFVTETARAYGLPINAKSGILQPTRMVQFLDALRPKSATFFGAVIFIHRRAGVTPPILETSAGPCKLVEAEIR